ncbi:hypothetical protein CFAM422_006637 [Trichoderma lentiforme]|uniref:Uncharacterized protein n=1 Tax=Trichoderma lentiforme TaxID=1567552 RepID=A0A9P4XF76_9HYPO|nr:hypothetical protein CFAM422_006637 [Trichoderma lentiforme]
MAGEKSLMDWGQVYSSVGVQYYHANIEMPPLATPIERCDQLHQFHPFHPFHPLRGREPIKDARTQTQQTSSHHIYQTRGPILRLMVEMPCILRWNNRNQSSQEAFQCLSNCKCLNLWNQVQATQKVMDLGSLKFTMQETI